MEKKLPDSYVPDRYTKSYPTEIGSQPFEPDNIELFKLDKTQNLKHHFVKKFDEIKSEYEKLMYEIQMNERIYKSKYNFVPIVGNLYYLYQSKGEEFLSLISPEEWNHKYQFIGKYILQTDGRWFESNE
jgi:hypothetical protein